MVRGAQRRLPGHALPRAGRGGFHGVLLGLVATAAFAYTPEGFAKPNAAAQPGSGAKPAAEAQPNSGAQPGPQLNSGVRRVDAEPAAAPAGSLASASGNGQTPPPRSHQTGPAPREPKATLPEGVPRTEADARARRRVALGRTSEERQAPNDDPELQALAEAEKTLFESDLGGLEPGWSWLPDAGTTTGGTEVSASGLPPAPPLVPPEAA